ncbi:MAG TPA: sugar ABC transporter permease [Chloroflexi bacterium]|jgi:arabinogalactan oligomer/maltooligosaccharide transport system permease protein|nr:sugar ABC transporter permease [Chloroflexota bacterium]
MIEKQTPQQETGAMSGPVTGAFGGLQATGIDLSRVRSKKRLRRDERVFLWISRVIIIAFALVILFPLVMVIDASVTPGQTFFVTSVIPQTVSLEHYQNVFDPSKTPIGTWLKNSAIVCLVTSGLSVLLVTGMAYAFSRFRFFGRKYGLMSLLLIQMFPAQMSFVALYYLLNYVHLLDSLSGLIVVFLGGGIPFNAWLFKGYIDGLPRDLEEAAYVDGATQFQAFWKVILPLTRPMMAVIFIFQTIGIYNDYILTNYLITDSGKYTVAVGLYGFLNAQFGQNWNDFAAGAVIATIPIAVLFLVAQRWLVSGLASGAVKG